MDREQHYAAAERRLGRKLTPGERNIDVGAINDQLATAKAALAAEIEKEKSRTIRALVEHGDPPYLQVTRGMLRVLSDLHVAGAAEAVAEIQRYGIDRPKIAEPEQPLPTLFAERGDSSRIRRAATAFVAKIRGVLPPMLGGISARVDEHAAELDFGAVPQRTMIEEMERLVPGSLDIASRLVSTTFYDGLGGVYEANADLFPAWTYSAIMDAATCFVCADWDGTEFDSWDTIQAVLPGGGPNPDCFGDGRCRCRAVPEPPA